MESIMQGDACSISVCLRSEDTVIIPDMAESVEISLGSITKKYPGEITFSGDWKIPLTQQETFNLTPGFQPMQIRVKFVNGDTSGVNCGRIFVNASISKEIL